MKKMLSALFTALCLLIVLSTASCARTVIPEEVLQLPEYSRVYTSYNLWHDADGNMSSVNIQKGSILPFGTEIQFIDANTSRIRFKAVNTGKVYTLRYDEDKTVIPVEKFIQRLFVIRDEKDLTIGVRPVIYEKIKRGIVEKNMTRKEVLLSCGPPPAMRTPSETIDSWIYWTDDGVTKRVIFFGNKVQQIIILD